VTLDPRQRALTTKPGPAATRIRAYQPDRASRTRRTAAPSTDKKAPHRGAFRAAHLTIRRPYQLTGLTVNEITVVLEQVENVFLIVTALL
jgi:hypothetical protein